MPGSITLNEVWVTFGNAGMRTGGGSNEIAFGFGAWKCMPLACSSLITWNITLSFNATLYWEAGGPLEDDISPQAVCLIREEPVAGREMSTYTQTKKYILALTKAYLGWRDGS